MQRSKRRTQKGLGYCRMLGKLTPWLAINIDTGVLSHGDTIDQPSVGVAMVRRRKDLAGIARHRGDTARLDRV